MKIAIVEWEDAAFRDDVSDADEAVPIRGVAVGHLMADEPDRVVVALEWFEDESYRRALAIPRGIIRSVRVIE